jgi:tetratricopeptide (TPR) repeat protein
VGPLPDGKALRVLALGFDRVLADLFWVRCVYYMGHEDSHKAGYPAANRLAELVTDIDPSFRTVYIVMSGGIAVLKGDPDGAIALLQKGIRHVDDWKLHFLLGFDYFVEKLDYASAAEQMRIASEKGGPAYLQLLASRLYADAGDPQTAFAFIQARLREEPPGETRVALEERYRDLWITRDLASIDAALSAYQKAHGRAPQRVRELVEAKLLEREPLDPRGGSYSIREGRAATDLEYNPLKMHVPHPPVNPAAVIPEKRGATP